MKKFLSILLAVCLLVSFVPLTASAEAVTTTIEVGTGKTYTTLQAAVDSVDNNGTATIKLTSDLTGGTLQILQDQDKNITIDFDNHKWTVDGATGSNAKHLSQGLHLEKGNTVTLQNGTIDIVSENRDRVASESSPVVRMLIMNYGTLNVTNMTLDGTNQREGVYKISSVGFTASNSPVLNSYNGVVALKKTTIKNTTVTGATPYSIGCGWWGANGNYSAGTQISVNSDCNLVNAVVYRDDVAQPSNSLSTLTYNDRSSIKGNWTQNSGSNTTKSDNEDIYNFDSTIGFYQTTDSTVDEVSDTTITGAHANPTNVVTFNGKTVTVNGELPYISGTEETAPNTKAGNYVWMKISLPTGVTRSGMTLNGTTLNESELDDSNNDREVDCLYLHQSITKADVDAKSKTITIKWDATHADVYTIDLTNATLADAPSNNGGNGGTATTPDDDDNDVTDTDETPTTNTVTADDGTVTTTTTWSDGKTSTSVKDPDGNVTTTVKSASGETIAEISLPAEPDEGKTFSDVNGWSKEAITKATGYGLFAGTTATTFEPQTGMTRAMVAQVLYNISGKGDYGTDSKHYNDVSGSYADAINWATAAGVVSGNGDGTFEPEETVTREQLVTMLYNFAKAIGAVEKSSTGVENFPDGDKTSDWATEAMNWAIANGIISGSTDNGVTTLNPRDTATREQVASVMVKFVEMLTK